MSNCVCLTMSSQSKTMYRHFIDPRLPLVNAVTAWLLGQSRTTPAGVMSLAHLLVVVPTRQAGRRLRFALARETGGCLPPVLRLPPQLIVPAHEPDLSVATPAETVACLARFLMDLDLHDFPDLFPEKGLPARRSFAWALGVARQLNDLWTMLQENALVMADVAARVEDLLAGDNLDVEVQRWQDLAALETRFFAVLKAAGRTPAPLYRKEAVADPLLPEGIEGIVLPGLADAQPALYSVLEKLKSSLDLAVLIHADPAQDARFDQWGRPVPSQWLGDQAPLLPFRDSQITLFADSSEQARFVADLFAAVPVDEERPSLGLADEALFRELQTAFLLRDIPIHSPAAFPLATSSLGRLIYQLERLSQPACPYDLLAAFLREADVMRWLSGLLQQEPDFSYAGLLRALDHLQNSHLPQTFEDLERFCDQVSDPGTQHLRAALKALRCLLDPKGRHHLEHLNVMLRVLFKPRTLRKNTPGDRELAAATEALESVFEALASSVVETSLDESQRSLLFESLLAEATYQLEPEDPDTLLTEGWLELPWSPAQELVITGFNEGAVPKAIVGHAFLPDRLREGLGMTSNDYRAARDAYLLHALLASRPEGAVRITLERLSPRKDVRKPSRLLFLCDDATLAARAQALFDEAEHASVGHSKSLPEAWRLDLPLPSEQPIRKLSATAFKNYLACPFTFYLSNVLKMEACDDRLSELDALTFGDLCHGVLQKFAASPLKDSTEASAIAAFLESAVWERVHTSYGETLTAVIRLQALAACERLRFFAELQAGLRKQGRRIDTAERKLELTLANGFTVTGRADRIDYCEKTDTWYILDYKTWNKLGKEEGVARFSSATKGEVARAVDQGLKSFGFQKKERVWTDLQLPLYLLQAKACGVVSPDARIECGYFVIGETAEETQCVTWDFTEYQQVAQETADWVVNRLRAGIFWPPSPKEVWARDYTSLFLESPEKSLASKWIDDQEKRLKKGGQP